MPIVNHPNAAPFASPSQSPADFAKPSTSFQKCSLFGPEHQSALKGPIILVVEKSFDLLREDRSLDETHKRVYANGVVAVKVVISCSL